MLKQAFHEFISSSRSFAQPWFYSISESHYLTLAIFYLYLNLPHPDPSHPFSRLLFRLFAYFAHSTFPKKILYNFLLLYFCRPYSSCKVSSSCTSLPFPLSVVVTLLGPLPQSLVPLQPPSSASASSVTTLLAPTPGSLHFLSHDSFAHTPASPIHQTSPGRCIPLPHHPGEVLEAPVQPPKLGPN